MRYTAFWSEADQQWVGICSGYTSLSWLADTEAEALKGIRRLVAEEEAEDDNDWFEEGGHY